MGGIELKLIEFGSMLLPELEEPEEPLPVLGGIVLIVVHNLQLAPPYTLEFIVAGKSCKNVHITSSGVLVQIPSLVDRIGEDRVPVTVNMSGIMSLAILVRLGSLKDGTRDTARDAERTLH